MHTLIYSFQWLLYFWLLNQSISFVWISALICLLACLFWLSTSAPWPDWTCLASAFACLLMKESRCDFVREFFLPIIDGKKNWSVSVVWFFLAESSRAICYLILYDKDWLQLTWNWQDISWEWKWMLLLAVAVMQQSCHKPKARWLKRSP